MLVEGVADVAVEEGVAALGEAVEAACFALRRDARAEGGFGAGGRGSLRRGGTCARG